MQLIDARDIAALPQDGWEALLKRPVHDVASLNEKVKAILDDVKARGNEAVKAFTQTFDGVVLDDLIVSEEEKGNAGKQLTEALQHNPLSSKPDSSTRKDRNDARHTLLAQIGRYRKSRLVHSRRNSAPILHDTDAGHPCKAGRLQGNYFVFATQ